MATPETTPPSGFKAQMTTMLRDAEPKDMVAILRSLVEYRSVLERSREKADADEWRSRYLEAQKGARHRADVIQKIYDRYAASTTALAAADKRALIAAIRVASGSSSAGKKMASGEALFRSWLKKTGPSADQNAGEGSYLNVFESKPTILRNLRHIAALPLDSKQRPWLTQHALDLKLWTPDELRAEIGEEAWQAYLDGITQEGRDDSANMALISKIETGSLTKPDLEKIKNAAILATDITADDVVRPDTAASALEKDLSELMSGVAGGGVAKEGRWYGLTDDEIGDMVKRPGLRRWAKEHGFGDLGSLESNGFVPGKDTNRMLLEIIRQRGMKHSVNRFGGDFEDEVEVVGGNSGPQLFVNSGINDKKLTAVWAVNPNGSVEYLDLAAGTTTPAKDAAGRWLSKSLEQQYAADAKRTADVEAGETEATPRPLGFKGMAPLSKGAILAGGPIDLSNQSFTPEAEDLLMPLPPKVVISGKRRLPTYGEDPDTVAHIRQPDGSIVTLRRVNEDAPWQVDSDVSSLKYAGYAKQKPDIKPDDLPEADDVPERARTADKSNDPDGFGDLGEEGRPTGQILADMGPKDEPRVRVVPRRAAADGSPVYEDPEARSAVTDSTAFKKDEAEFLRTLAGRRAAADGSPVYEDPNDRPAVMDSPALKKEEKAYKKDDDRAKVIARRKMGPSPLEGVVDDFATVPEDRPNPGLAAAEKAKQAAKVTAALATPTEEEELAIAARWAADAEKAKRDAAIIQEMRDRAAVRALGRELEEPGLAAVDAVRGERMKKEAEAERAAKIDEARGAVLTASMEAERAKAVGGPVATRSSGMARIPLRGGYHPVEAEPDDSKQVDPTAAAERDVRDLAAELEAEGRRQKDELRVAALRRARQVAQQ